MKYVSLILCPVFLLLSCKSNNKPDEAKIKASITAYLTGGSDKKDVPKIDSIAIVSADTLTEKNSLKMALDRRYSMLKGFNAIFESKAALIKADSALLWSLQQQDNLYKKHGEKYDDASLKAQAVKMNSDSMELDESRISIDKTRYSIDSISKLYNGADSVSFYAYYVNADVFISGAGAERGTFIISKDWKVRR